MHVHCLHWLMSTGLLLQSAFFQPCKIHDWWNGTNGGLQFGSGDLIWLPLSAHICLGLVVEYWSFVGTCGCHSQSKLYHWVILLLCFSFYHYPPLPPTHPLIYTGLRLMNSMKKSSKTSENQPLSTCQVSCTKANSVSCQFSDIRSLNQLSNEQKRSISEHTRSFAWNFP